MITQANGLMLLLVLLCLGCNSQFGDVTGKVTLDGAPLVGATVEFSPEGGSPAYGLTDEAGKYKLQWTAEQSGAQLGKHRVRITSFNEAKPRIKERVPLKYNRKSELTAEVSRGRQNFDFELVSK
ncbi:carboxypeptidase-like regulatory domain-containing protein [Anatilimnocola floriformis]|uniref:carboxypeptidase-like regulatory domain-containing protein n=1 Tax=Anatilimnocola floriformis TaxID=2948575 RepID=UPI0020C27DF7|nr:carboxypeptidase-like regulatory domain-containing protein [Anatilimnocola floriformis]